MSQPPQASEYGRWSTLRVNNLLTIRNPTPAYFSRGSHSMSETGGLVPCRAGGHVEPRDGSWLGGVKSRVTLAQERSQRHENSARPSQRAGRLARPAYQAVRGG